MNMGNTRLHRVSMTSRTKGSLTRADERVVGEFRADEPKQLW